jgi:hypothetical protein
MNVSANFRWNINKPLMRSMPPLSHLQNTINSLPSYLLFVAPPDQGSRLCRGSAPATNPEGPSLRYCQLHKTILDEQDYVYEPVETFGEGLITNRPWNTTALARVELLNGRVAMVGFLAAVIGELLTGRGIVGQLELMVRWYLG